MIQATHPDVVLLDVHLPGGGGGHTVITELADRQLPTRFLALSVSDAADDVIAVVQPEHTDTSPRPSPSTSWSTQ